jgi:hypothetical protein
VSIADQSQASCTYTLRGEESATQGAEAEEQARAIFQRNSRVEYLCAAVSGLRGLITLDPANTKKEVELPLLLLRHSLKMDMLAIKAIGSIFDEMDGFRKLAKRSKDTTAAAAATTTSLSLQDTREQGGYLLRATREYWKCALWFACANELAGRRFNQERCRCCSSSRDHSSLSDEASSPSLAAATAATTTALQASGTVFALSSGANNIGLHPLVIEVEAPPTRGSSSSSMQVSSSQPGLDASACTCTHANADSEYESESESESDVISRYFLLERRLLRLGLEGVWDMRPILDGKALMQLFKVKAGPVMGKLMEIQLQWQLQNPPPPPQPQPLSSSPSPSPAGESIELYTQRCVDFMRSVHERKRTMTDEELVVP